MRRVKSKISLTQDEIDGLNKAYKGFIKQLLKKWLRNNNHPPRAGRLIELDDEERQRVALLKLNWEVYITPIAEKWWKRRGFGICWPEESSDPCKIYQL